MAKWMWLCAALFLTSCMQDQPSPDAEEPDTCIAAHADYANYLEELVGVELIWRLPNSHASLLSGEAALLRSHFHRGEILRLTLMASRAATPEQLNDLQRQLSSTDDTFRAIVLCRMLATCGVPRPAILKHVPSEILYEEVIYQAIEEGQALRELL